MPVGRSLAQGGGQGGLSGECYFTAVPRLPILPITAIPERTNSLQHLTGIELDLVVDKAPRLSIRIVIWILPSDTVFVSICQLNKNISKY